MTPRATLLLLFLVLTPACGETEAEREAQQQALAGRVRMEADGAIVLTDEERQALHVETAPATPGEGETLRTVYGAVTAAPGSEVEVTAPLTGIVDGPPLVVLGEKVDAGAPLVRLIPSLDTGERASLAVRRHELEGQIAELEQRVAQQDEAAARAKKLYEQGIESLADLQAAETDAAGWRARLAAGRKELASLEAGTAETLTVRSPIAGVIGALETEDGLTVRQGEGMLTVLGEGGRRIDVGVVPGSPPATSWRVQVGSEWVPAKHIGSGGLIGADGLRHELLEAPAGTALEPGATVLVRIGAGEARGVVLPASAVVPVAGGEMAFVEEESGRYLPRRLQVTERGPDRVVVASGVEAGERVVSRGAMELWGEMVKAGATGEDDATAHGR